MTPLVLALALLGEPVLPQAGAVVGTATLRLERGGEQATSHLTYSASETPRAVRAEIVRAGRLLAVVWMDDVHLRVLVPGDPDLLHEGPATRESLDQALGLPFCPDEIVFALRLGMAAPPHCEGGEAATVVRRGDRTLGLARAGTADRHLEFSGFARQGDRSWPRRALLTAPEGSASLQFLFIEERPVAAREPTGAPWTTAAHVDARSVAAALGLDVTSSETP